MLITFPVFVNAGPIRISAHLIFESLAYSVAFAFYRRLKHDRGDFLPTPDRLSVIVAAMCGAALGSRVLYWFEDPVLTLRHIFDLGYLMAGKTIVGGLLGGTAAVEWIKRRTGIHRRTGDLFALPIVVGIAIGRIGCFFAGLPDNTYGVATSLPWGVDFGDGVRRHPTQLYELLFLCALVLWLTRKRRRPHREGDIYRRFLISYLAFRLAIDFLKPGHPLAGLTALQWACLAAIIAYWRDILFFFVPEENHPSWLIASAPISSTTPPPRSARGATGASTPR